MVQIFRATFNLPLRQKGHLKRSMMNLCLSRMYFQDRDPNVLKHLQKRDPQISEVLLRQVAG